MFKYLITSDYQHYDDFAFSNVCICDTKEKAEELIKEFNKNKEEFKKTLGYIIHLDKKLFIDSIFVDFDEKYIIDDKSSTLKIFVNENLLEKDLLDKILSDESDIYYQENNFFEFLTFSHNKNNLIQRYCNHEDAMLRIEEIEFI